MSRNRHDRENNDYNQSPCDLSNDSTTRNDLNGTVNSTKHRAHRINHEEINVQEEPVELITVEGEGKNHSTIVRDDTPGSGSSPFAGSHEINNFTSSIDAGGSRMRQIYRRALQVFIKFSKFVGPGMMVSVAYIDPVN